MSVPPLAVRGLGLWRPAPGAETPPPRLPPRLRRRASVLVGMIVEVATQAADAAGVSLGAVPLVAGSAYGELGTTMSILRDIEGEGLVSPTQFQGSVHNTAIATLSIAHDNRSSSTSIAAGAETFAMVLLEAWGVLSLGGGPVLAIVADEAIPAELLGGARGAAVASALVLEAAPGGLVAGPPPLAWLDDLRAGGVVAAAADEGPAEAGARLVDAIRARRTGRIELGASGWSCGLRRVEGA